MTPAMTDDILRMSGITKAFPGVRALHDVNLSVRRGEIHAICGENGAGKSTLMKVLSGVYPHGSYAGEILFDGEPCRFSGIRDSEQRGIVIIHQELALCPQLSIAENIFLGNERASRGLIDWNRTNHEAGLLLERVGLAENPVTLIQDVGVGKQQLVEIAKALAKRVRLLILDEPTAALNDEDSAHLLDLLRGLRDEGITCVIISHKLNEVIAIADARWSRRCARTPTRSPRTGSSPAWSGGTWSTGSRRGRSRRSGPRRCASRTGPCTTRTGGGRWCRG
jgi:putative multiple sugar transport system ATP-binding protein